MMRWLPVNLEQGDSGLQQGVQSALRFHSIRHLPAASTGKPLAGAHRGWREELRALNRAASRAKRYASQARN